MVGASIDGGRGNVTLGLEHYNRKSINRIDRPWYEVLARSPDVAGSEFFLNENFISYPAIPGGGAAANFQPSQAALNTYFRGVGAPATVSGQNVNIPRTSSVYLNDNGSLFINTSTRLTAVAPATTGQYVPLFYGYQGEIDGLVQKLLTNGQLAQNNLEQLLSTPQTRWLFFAKGEYDVRDNVRFVSQGNFARTQTHTLSLNTVAIGSFGTLIPYDSNIYTGNATLGIAKGAARAAPTLTPAPGTGLRCLPRPSGDPEQARTASSSPGLLPPQYHGAVEADAARAARLALI